jgi:hypothetical protein
VHWGIPGSTTRRATTRHSARTLLGWSGLLRYIGRGPKWLIQTQRIGGNHEAEDIDGWPACSSAGGMRRRWRIVIKVVGANKFALQVTFSSTGATVQIDANGDGTYESSSSVAAAQLKALL